METNCGLSDKNGKKPRETEENAAPELLPTAAGAQLERLRHVLSERGELGSASTPLTLEQLEMLEAELKNQGILPTIDGSLFQHALHTSSILRWRGRRAGVVCDGFDFRIDVPRYVVARAEQIEQQLTTFRSAETGAKGELLLHRSSSWGKGLDSPSRLLSELTSLDAFAGYLLGKFEQHTNRYQRGLNLLLKILTTGEAKKDVEASKGPQIVLPVEPREFLERLKPLRLQESQIDR